MQGLTGFPWGRTPPSGGHLLKFSLQERRDVLAERVKELQKERFRLWDLLGRPNKKKLKCLKGREYADMVNQEFLVKYFSLGEELRDVMVKQGELRRRVEALSEHTKDKMFVHAAKQLLPKETFSQIRKYANNRLANLYSKVESGDEDDE